MSDLQRVLNPLITGKAEQAGKKSWFGGSAKVACEASAKALNLKESQLQSFQSTSEQLAKLVMDLVKCQSSSEKEDFKQYFDESEKVKQDQIPKNLEEYKQLCEQVKENKQKEQEVLKIGKAFFAQEDRKFEENFKEIKDLFGKEEKTKAQNLVAELKKQLPDLKSVIESFPVSLPKKEIYINTYNRYVEQAKQLCEQWEIKFEVDFELLDLKENELLDLKENDFSKNSFEADLDFTLADIKIDKALTDTDKKEAFDRALELVKNKFKPDSNENESDLAQWDKELKSVKDGINKSNKSKELTVLQRLELEQKVLEAEQTLAGLKTNLGKRLINKALPASVDPAKVNLKNLDQAEKDLSILNSLKERLVNYYGMSNDELTTKIDVLKTNIKKVVRSDIQLKLNNINQDINKKVEDKFFNELDAQIKKWENILGKDTMKDLKLSVKTAELTNKLTADFSDTKIDKEVNSIAKLLQLEKGDQEKVKQKLIDLRDKKVETEINKLTIQLNSLDPMLEESCSTVDTIDGIYNRFKKNEISENLTSMIDFKNAIKTTKVRLEEKISEKFNKDFEELKNFKEKIFESHSTFIENRKNKCENLDKLANIMKKLNPEIAHILLSSLNNLKKDLGMEKSTFIPQRGNQSSSRGSSLRSSSRVVLSVDAADIPTKRNEVIKTLTDILKKRDILNKESTINMQIKQIKQIRDDFQEDTYIQTASEKVLVRLEQKRLEIARESVERGNISEVKNKLKDKQGSDLGYLGLKEEDGTIKIDENNKKNPQQFLEALGISKDNEMYYRLLVWLKERGGVTDEDLVGITLKKPEELKLSEQVVSIVNQQRITETATKFSEVKIDELDLPKAQAAKEAIKAFLADGGATLTNLKAIAAEGVLNITLPAELDDAEAGNEQIKGKIKELRTKVDEQVTKLEQQKADAAKAEEEKLISSAAAKMADALTDQLKKDDANVTVDELKPLLTQKHIPQKDGDTTTIILRRGSDDEKKLRIVQEGEPGDVTVTLKREGDSFTATPNVIQPLVEKKAD